MGIRLILGFVSLFLLAGGVLLQFFIVLSGGVTGSPINQFYFLEASDIGSIYNARNPSRWTFWAICGVSDNGKNANCGSPVPALPFDPPRNFGTTRNVPGQFIGTHKFYYLSRFMFAFYLIALVFAVIGLFTGCLALCSRLGGYLSGLTVAIALFFQILAASLQTAWVVEGRDAFHSSGFGARVGTKLMAFAWTSMSCFLISTVLFFLGGAMGNDSGSSGLGRKHSQRSTRSRGSFLDGSQRKSKDYSP